MNRSKILLVLLGLLLVVGAWYALLWSPAAGELSTAQDRELTAQSQLVSLDAELDGLIEMEANRPQFQSDLEALRSGIPATADAAALLTSVNSAATAAGVDFLDYNATQPTEGVDSALGEVGIQIAGTGGYFQLLDFLNRLNDVHRIIVVDRITIDAQTSEDVFGPPSLNWQMTLRAFVQPLPGGTPVVDDGAGETTGVQG